MRFLLFTLLASSVYGQTGLIVDPYKFASAPAGPEFTPTNISGMAYFWNYQDLLGNTNTASLSWTDRIQGVVFTNNVQATSPTNNLFGLHFFNTWFTNLPGLTIASNFSYWTVVYKINDGDTYSCLLDSGSRQNGFFYRSSGIQLDFRYFHGGTEEGASTAVDTTLGLSTDYVWANGTSYTNAVLTGVNSPTTAMTVAIKNMGEAAAASRILKGFVQYIGIWTNYALTATDVTKLNDWGNTNQFQNITTGLLAWWKLDENTGTTIADSSGNGWSGTLLSASGGAVPIWTNAQINTGLQFGGNPFGPATSTNYVTITSSQTLADTNSATLTISLWYRQKVATNASDPKVVLSKIAQEGQNTDNRYPGWEIRYDDASLSMYYVQSNSANASSLWGQYCSGFYDTNWHHFAAVKDSTGTNLFQYVDGIFQTGGYISQQAVTNWTSTNNVMMGWNLDSHVVPSDLIGAVMLDDEDLQRGAELRPGAGALSVGEMGEELLNE
jgi:hypothetical protein